MALTNKLTVIADVIRSKTGYTNKLTLDEMSEKIQSIETGSSSVAEPYVEETYDEDGNLVGVNMVGHTVIRPYAFNNCESLVMDALPESIISIGSSAFSRCTNITLTKIPEKVQTIGSYTFYYCTGLTEITFEGTPTSISSTAFPSCANLTVINVPWGEDEVANAPWGATNATVNYNYTNEE